MSRNTREDVVRAAGRLFATRGYDATSMRDLGRELGLVGSSLYSHVAGKQELLVEVVERGAALFAASATEAQRAGGSALDRLRRFVAGHIDVVLDHRDEARTFLNEASSLEERYRNRIVEVRDRYEAVLRDLLRAGATTGEFGRDLDPKFAGIVVLSILNAVDRWYDDAGPIDRQGLVDRIISFVTPALV